PALPGMDGCIGAGREWPHLLLVFASAFALYCWSMPRTVVFEDDGLFIMASYFNGTAHPPGYPLLTLIGHLATLIPVGSVALRVHLVSALFGALSCVVMYKVALYLFKQRGYAYAAALFLAVSREFWSQAIISEVYTLNVFILLLLVLFSMYQAEEGRPFSRRLFYGMALLYGLGLSNHWPLLILTSPALLLILWPVWRDVVKALPKAIPFLLLGLTPYLWLVIRSHMHPVISFYGHIDNWQQFWFMVSREGYAHTDVEAGATIWDKLLFARFVLEQTAVQLGPLGVAFGLVGFIRQWRVWKTSFCLALLFGFLGSTFVLVALLGFNYDVLHQDVFRVYPVNAYAIMVLWVCLGIRYFSELAVRLIGPRLAVANLRIFLAVLVAGTALLINIPYNYRAGDRLAEEYAHVVLNSLAPNAIFFTMGDVDTFTLGYAHLVEGVRPDVSLYHSLGLVFSTRLVDPLTADDETRYKVMSDFIKKETRPIYYISDIPKLFGYDYFGPYSKVDKKLDKKSAEIIVNKNIIGFYERLLDSGDSYDPWERMVQHSMIADYCKIMTQFNQRDKQDHTADLLRICRSYGAQLVLINSMLEQKSPDRELIQDLLQKAAKQRHDAPTARDYITYDILYGRFLLLQNRHREALRHFKLAIKEWPNPANPGYALLKKNTSSADGKGEAAAAVTTAGPDAPPERQ
ncbi:MAG: DUF2723 domain-containing protein, partial [Gammaproteobacteria bacterium]